jgi:hypothetical protein
MIQLQKYGEKEEEMLYWILLSQECIQQCLDFSKPIQENEIDSKLPLTSNNFKPSIIPDVGDVLRLLQQNIRYSEKNIVSKCRQFSQYEQHVEVVLIEHGRPSHLVKNWQRYFLAATVTFGNEMIFFLY